MKNEALYNKTVNILVAAYFNDTLKHGDCTACAVANILSDTADKNAIPRGRWANLFFSPTCNGESKPQFRCKDGEIIMLNVVLGIYIRAVKDERDREVISEAKMLIDSSGYTIDNLAAIENAFEVAPKDNSEDEYMFNGLMSVIDCLDKIHENNSPALTTATKEKFNRAEKVKVSDTTIYHNEQMLGQ